MIDHWSWFTHVASVGGLMSSGRASKKSSTSEQVAIFSSSCRRLEQYWARSSRRWLATRDTSDREKSRRPESKGGGIYHFRYEKKNEKYTNTLAKKLRKKTNQKHTGKQTKKARKICSPPLSPLNDSVHNGNIK